MIEKSTMGRYEPGSCALLCFASASTRHVAAEVASPDLQTQFLSKNEAAMLHVKEICIRGLFWQIHLRPSPQLA